MLSQRPQNANATDIQPYLLSFMACSFKMGHGQWKLNGATKEGSHKQEQAAHKYIG